MNAESKQIEPEKKKPGKKDKANAGPPDAPTDEAHDAMAELEEELKAHPGRRRVLMLAVPLLLLVGGGAYWLTGGRYITTENAYVHQPMVAISSDVSGRIAKVDVTENQVVDQGATLFSIDPVPYRIALDRADAALASARLSVVQLRAGYATAQAQLEAAKSILELRERELQRQKELTDRGVGTASQLDESNIATSAARSNVTVAQRQLDAAAAALGGTPDTATDDMPSVRAAIAARDSAVRDLAHTEIHAPAAGIVSQLGALNVGQFLSAGTEIASLVRTNDTWVEANFKETQLEGIAIGQPVTITVDAYPDVALHGTVASFGSATGSQFSLIPAQNATGNWVKVVQRVSVRIRIDDTPPIPLKDGMSAYVSVDTGHSRLDLLK